MVAPAEKRTPGQKPRRRGRVPGGRTSADPASTPERGLAGETGRQAGSIFGPPAGLRARGLKVLTAAAAPEKEKVSITLDKPLVDEIREHFGGRALSTSINELLYAALAQERLAELVDEMEQEAGPPSADAFERVLAQWFAEE